MHYLHKNQVTEEVVASDNWGTQVVQHDATLTGSGTASDPLRVDKSNVDTDEQLLSINGNQLTISNGNTVSIPTGGTDADSDPNNEIQDLSNTKTNEEVTISITDGNSTTFNVNDQDADPNNELQELSNSASGNEVTLNISDGNSTTFNVSDSDADSSNEIQDLSGTSSGNDITLNITGGSGVTFSVEDGDTHSSNELQDLSINGNQLSISNGNTVNLPSSSLWSQNDQFLGIHYLNEVSIGSQDVFGELNVNGRGVFFNQGTATVRTTIGNATLDFQGASGQKTLLMSGEDAGSIELREGGNPLMLMAESATGGGFSGIWNKFGSRVIVHQTNAQNGVGEIFTQAASIFNSYNGFLQDQPTHGFFSVLDDDSQSQAGLFVDAGGNGVVFADIKNFRMDYPGRDNQEIWYASLEGPEAAAYERGTATLANGEAFVAYSDHFSIITNLEGTTMILTPLSAASFGLAVVKKESNGFYVKELNNGTGNYSFDWESKAIRKGYEKFEPVRDKSYAKSGMTSIQN